MNTLCLNPQQERHERMAIAPTSFAGAAAQQRAWQVRSERPLLDWETPNETPARTKLPNSAEDRRFESISLQQRVCELSVLGAAKAWKFDLATGEAVVGRDPVPTYAIAERDGEILIDFRDPPATERRASALRGIEAAIRDATTGAKSPSDSPARKSNSRRCSSRISRNKFRVDASARNHAIERSTAMKLCAEVLGNCLLLQ